MEYLEGETLSQRLKRGPLPTGEVLRYAIEIAERSGSSASAGGDSSGPEAGQHHADRGGAKLLDFGLGEAKLGGDLRPVESRPSERAAHFHGPKSESLTEEGMILGTLEYMAPEQLEGKEADARTDIFALGVVIYEMATGRKAFEGDSKASVIVKILTAPASADYNH